jgi:hypothetical protein
MAIAGFLEIERHDRKHLFWIERGSHAAGESNDRVLKLDFVD